MWMAEAQTFAAFPTAFPGALGGRELDQIGAAETGAVMPAPQEAP